MGLDRKNIRETVISILKADSTLTALVPANSIYESRVETIWRTELPAIAVYTKSESSDDFSQFNRILNKTLTLAIEIVVEGTENLDDDLDEISDAIEKVLLNSEYLVFQDRWQDLRMIGFQTAYQSEGAKAIGAGRMEFEIDYQTIYD